MLKQGDGAIVEDGDTVVVHYTGVLWDDGKVFDFELAERSPRARSSSARAAKEVIPGFSEASSGRQVGSQVGVVVLPSEGYGDQGSGSIPAGLHALLRRSTSSAWSDSAMPVLGRSRPSMIAPVPVKRQSEPGIPVEERLFSLVLALLATERA